jgi:hypothetical protein
MLRRAGGTHALESRTVVLAMMLAIMTKLVAGLSIHRLAPSLVDVAGSGTRKCTKRVGESALLAMSTENIVVVGLTGNFVDGIWLVGASSRGSPRRKWLGVKFRGTVIFRSLNSGFVLKDVSIESFRMLGLKELETYPFLIFAGLTRRIRMERTMASSAGSLIVL